MIQNNKDMSETILGYTTEQIETIVHNYLIISSKNFLRVEKFIKIFSYVNPLGINQPNKPESIEVRVKTTNAFGKVKTEKIYIHPQNGEYSCVVGYEYSHMKLNELLNMEALPNTVFEKSFEETIAENQKKEAEFKHKEFISKLGLELNYNIKQCRKPSASKRSYKKYTIEQLQESLPELTEPQQEYLNAIIHEFNVETQPKQTLKQFIASFTGAKKELFEQLEKSFEEKEKIFLGKVITWFTAEYKHLTEVMIQKEAEYYVEIQKWNLFKAASKYLAPYDVKECLNTYFRSTDNGFEGQWLLTMSDGSTKHFETKTIIAEGLIQKAHYRYISNLK